MCLKLCYYCLQRTPILSPPWIWLTPTSFLLFYSAADLNKLKEAGISTITAVHQITRRVSSLNYFWLNVAFEDRRWSTLLRSGKWSLISSNPISKLSYGILRTYNSNSKFIGSPEISQYQGHHRGENRQGILPPPIFLPDLASFQSILTPSVSLLRSKKQRKRFYHSGLWRPMPFSKSASIFSTYQVVLRSLTSYSMVASNPCQLLRRMVNGAQGKPSSLILW